MRHDRWSRVAIKKFMVAEPVGSSVGTQSPIQNCKEEESDALSHGYWRADCRSNEHDAACYWFGFPLIFPGGSQPRCVVAGFVERGPAARSTRAELFGD